MTHSKTAKACTAMVAALLCAALCGCDLLLQLFGGEPAGFPLPQAVKLRIENQSGIKASVDATFVTVDEQVRVTRRIVEGEGPASVAETLFTVANEITARATIADGADLTKVAGLEIGDLLAAQVFRRNIDYLGGDTILFIIPPLEPPGPNPSDCNNNGTLDAADVENEVSDDCDTDLVPDECEPDGDTDGVIDDCDDCPEDPQKTSPGACGCGQADTDTDEDGVADCLDLCPGGDDAVDCNSNGTPDDCELDGDDCNSNGTPDECELVENDCNSNGTPDECDLVENDCNTNGLPDDCDIFFENSFDCNTDGVPDECQLVENDCNSNGVPDDCEPECGLPPTIDCPADVTVSCIELVPDPDPNAVSASTDCEGGVTVTHDGDEVVQGAGQPRGCQGQEIIIHRTYRAADACGNENTCVQTITVVDLYEPGIVDCPAPVTVPFLGPNGRRVPDVIPDLLASDNCAGLIVVNQFPEAGTMLTMGNTTVTLTVSDPCGNESQCDLTVTVTPEPELIEIFVDNSPVSGQRDGLSWQTPFATLDAALDVARSNPAVYQIRVAAGVGPYTPDADGDRTKSFDLVRGVAVLGGFAGGESGADERDPRANPTILSGDLLGDDAFPGGGRNDNSLHVVTARGVGPTTILDGFLIAAGTADGSGDGARGGGLLITEGAAPGIVNCTFLNNVAVDHGGAVFIDGGSSATVSHCRFLGNSASGGEGATGGAVCNDGGQLSIVNSTFSGNVAARGGALAASGGAVSVVNSTLYGNHATVIGGGLCLDAGTAALTNLIVYSNSLADPTAAGAQFAGGAAYGFDHCCVQGWTGALGGSGNFDAAPALLNPAGPDGQYGTLDDDLRAGAASPCIDAGNTAAVPSDQFDINANADWAEPVPFDLAGASRRVDDPAVPDVGSDAANPPVVDIGAYERAGD